VNFAVALATLLAVELAGRLFLFRCGAFDVLFLQPDRAVGWTQVPGLHWTWAGTHWYAQDYRVDVVTNSHGFRDLERSLEKPRGTTRIALLGDSFIEAVQVPLAHTAGPRLEQRLRERGPYEVLNFGISNYGIGQYLLVWEAYARRFSPDSVVVFAAEFHAHRTVTRFESGAFPSSDRSWLWVRPTLALRDGELVRDPAADFAAFRSAQEDVIQKEFHGTRMRLRESSVLAHLWRRLAAAGTSALPQFPPAPLSTTEPTPEQRLAINLAVLRELGEQVEASGARFVIGAADGYFTGPSSRFSSELQKLCGEHGFGYAAVGERIAAASARGRNPRWAHDGHFNAAGNEILAEALYEALAPGHADAAAFSRSPTTH
jgi:hypothetical protein